MTSKTYSHIIDEENIRSISQVIFELERLNDYLKDTELETLTYFNRVYVAVTKQFQGAVSDGVFSHPELVELLDIEFAHHYFSALNHFVEYKRLPQPWQNIIIKRIFTPFYFLLGANVHINHDLPLTIAGSIKNPEVFLDDFNRGDAIITLAIEKFLQSYAFKGKFIFIKKLFCSLYLKPEIHMILRWRHNAWQSAQKISLQKVTTDDLVRQTRRKSKNFIWYGRMIGGLFYAFR